jgi:hypothetical protein
LLHALFAYAVAPLLFMVAVPVIVTAHHHARCCVLLEVSVSKENKRRKKKGGVHLHPLAYRSFVGCCGHVLWLLIIVDVGSGGGGEGATLI